MSNQNPSLFAEHDLEQTTQNDDRGSLAIVAGMLAAVAGGLIWAVIVIAANIEIGWAAWGLGALVGFAMSQVTSARTRSLAITAAVLAACGLLAGKALIHYGSTSSFAEEIGSSQENLQGALAWQMYYARELEPATLESLDAWRASGDTLSDALWAIMTAESSARVAAMSPAERQAAAQAAARSLVSEIGLVQGVVNQLSGWDLLWVALAVGTAFRMMSGSAPPVEEETHAEKAELVG